MVDLRFAVFGTGFWARYQLAAWQEVAGARCVALYNRTRAKAEALAQEFGILAVYDDAEELLQREEIDFADIITDVGTHSQLVCLAARSGVPVICQKPLAESIEVAERMVAVCAGTDISLLVHENWRWQTPIRELRRILDQQPIGKVFSARIEYCNCFPVFETQPFLKALDQFILTDMGTHILDVTRFLFGEAESVYCQTHTVHRDIRGEDAAELLLKMEQGLTVGCAISYASRTARSRFPQTFVLVQGEHGSVELGPDYRILVTTETGTWERQCTPPHYPWSPPERDVVQSSIVPCNAHLLAALRGEVSPETSGSDNLKTLRLVYAAYESARDNRVVAL